MSKHQVSDVRFEIQLNAISSLFWYLGGSERCLFVCHVASSVRMQVKMGIVRQNSAGEKTTATTRATKPKIIVAWDFSRKPSGTFYRVLLDEFGRSHPGGDYELIQRSVALCRDDFVASRLAALAEYFGAKVGCFTVEREGLDTKSQEEGRAFVERVLSQRLHRRGRHPSARH